MRGAIFFDLDGVILKWRTNEPIKGALELVQKLHENGIQIIFTTRRGMDDPNDECAHLIGDPVVGREATEELLKELFPDIPYQVLWGVDSPRILINDEGGNFGLRFKNEPWMDTDIGKVLEEFEYLQQYLHQNEETESGR